ncbi:hypothetical protein O1611_g6237 [Lasiodiplodia mahajangana]|uniref:Uncharacterized protein n=1 Tax=Lasiodiplodia mahajangana TaxID=1108764 RepID=A0ACC2JIS5_9PEZI|nr:hypothetical protein O1611_g6237 [Lasiodiplodia mahajangana]
MSTRSSLSSRAESPTIVKPGVDDEVLPSGHCRYILLNPEIKGNRCACVGFTLNRSQPGVTCLCGHLSCYHVRSTESPPDSCKNEMEELRRRVQMLEGQLDRENLMVQRLGNLEEQFETSRGEISQEMKDCYGNVNRMWLAHGQLDSRQAAYEVRLATYDKRLDGCVDSVQRLSNRLIEADEASMALEERIEALEDRALPFRSHRPHGQQQSTSEAERTKQWLSQYGGILRTQPLSTPTHGASQASPASVTLQTRVPWTVHVSLLPTAAQPFPFEKDTNAYKRCLSRGLHQMVPVGGTDSESFNKAINKAFGSLLRGRAWMPLQARLCDAVTLEGLPMLRPLDSGLLGRPYDLEFLKQYCAVCHPTGKVESLYIAMVHDTFSWHFLRHSPCHLDGLESSWEYDQLLDRDDNLDDDTAGEDDRPPAGDIMPPLPSLKRTASEISRAASFSAAEGDGSRPKLARMQVEVCRRGVETI